MRKGAKVQRCDVCRRRIRNPEATVYQVICPKGLRLEVMQDAIRRAEEREETSPTPEGPERDAYILLSLDAPVSDESERVIVGRAFHALGFTIVQMHSECKDEPDSNEYVTEGWREYGDSA